MATLRRNTCKVKRTRSTFNRSNRTGGDNAIHPFRNPKESRTSNSKILTDGDKENTFFSKERLMIKLPFAGIKGDTDSETHKYKSRMEMYGETCPTLQK